MIEDIVKGNVFATTLKHIAFAVNTEGINNNGFAGQVADHFVPQIAKTGCRRLGEVVTFEAQGKVFHGLVCHKNEVGGWEKAPDAITVCLDKIDLPAGDAIAVVLMGSGFVGLITGADIEANIRAIHRSRNKCIIYSLDIDKEVIMAVANSLI